MEHRGGHWRVQSGTAAAEVNARQLLAFVGCFSFMQISFSNTVFALALNVLRQPSLRGLLKSLETTELHRVPKRMLQRRYKLRLLLRLPFRRSRCQDRSFCSLLRRC
jgi:hypothetical protein